MQMVMKVQTRALLAEKGKCIEDSHTDTSARQRGDQVAKGGTKK